MDIVNPFRLVSMFQRIFVLSVILSFSAPAHAQLQNENLMVTMPEGYKLGFQEKKDNQLINEMVPAGENVKDWTEMLTVQIFFGMKDATPEQFKQRLEKLWSENRSRAIEPGRAGGRARLSDDGVDPVLPAEQADLQAGIHLAQGDPRQRQFLSGAEGVPLQAGEGSDRAMVALSARRICLR